MTRFHKLLVANRGEIAVRVIRTARALGYQTVAVYSDADRDAPHVSAADEAVRLGPGPVADSYLHAERVLQAAQRTGARALHPGYGFFSENAEFATRCRDAGLVFVGPPPEAIRLMGDKVEAKRRMTQAGVPTAPAYLGTDQDDARLVAEAESLGLPLLVKAVAGGGGRGMRRVTDVAELAEAIRSARSEAASAFGNGNLFLEQLIEGARHIEVQVFADEHGNAVHLGERECSVQRRHQKIVEEAPSPAVDAELRSRLGEAAVAAARAIDYVGAGTVEFLLDDEGRFFFLEMNTRLQVEHPVTEEVTGFDLVQWQLDVAQGDPLPRQQETIELVGHSIEARLYAEDPGAGFLPQVGVVHRFVSPVGPGIRVDAGLESGQAISSFYDPMVAKIIATGATRDEARRRLMAALRRTSAVGLTTNRDFLLELVGSEAFESAAIKTDTIDREWADTDRMRLEPSAEHWAVAAALVARGAATAWNSTALCRWPVSLRNGDETRVFEVEVSASGMVVSPGEGEEILEVSVWSEDDGDLRVDVGGVLHNARAYADGRHLYLDYRGRMATFEEPTAASKHDAGPSDGQVRAPIGGKVIAVDVEPGANVQAGERLVSVEAMKIEHRIAAPVAGTITSLGVSVGDQVVSGQLLCAVEPEQEQA